MKKYILLLVIFIVIATSCRTATRTIEKHRESVESLEVKKRDVELKNDSIGSVKSQSLTEDQLLSLISKINFIYTGTSSKDSASIQIMQTQDGIKVNVTGNADASFSSESNHKSESKSDTKQSEGTVNQIKSENLDETNKSKSKAEGVSKKAESKTTGFQFSFWMWIIIATIIIIVLWWFFGRPKENKY